SPECRLLDNMMQAVGAAKTERQLAFGAAAGDAAAPGHWLQALDEALAERAGARVLLIGPAASALQTQQDQPGMAWTALAAVLPDLPTLLASGAAKASAWRTLRELAVRRPSA